MKILRDPLTSLAAASVAGLLVLTAAAQAVGGDTPHPVVAVDVDLDELAGLRARMPALLRMAATGDPGLAAAATRLADDAAEAARLRTAVLGHSDPVATAYRWLAVDAAALAQAAVEGDQAAVDRTVSRVLGDVDAVTTAALTGVLVDVAGGALVPGEPELTRELPDPVRTVSPDAPTRPRPPAGNPAVPHPLTPPTRPDRPLPEVPARPETGSAGPSADVSEASTEAPTAGPVEAQPSPSPSSD